MVDPEPEEIAAVEAATGFTIPSRDALSEIETSSRLRRLGQTFYLSTPALARGDSAEADLSPLGFVLSPAKLVTIRFAKPRVFATAADQLGPLHDPDGLCALVVLREGMGARAADLLEAAGAELDPLSRQVFRNAGRQGRRLARPNPRLRLTLAEVGQLGDR